MPTGTQYYGEDWNNYRLPDSGKKPLSTATTFFPVVVIGSSPRVCPCRLSVKALFRKELKPAFGLKACSNALALQLRIFMEVSGQVDRRLVLAPDDQTISRGKRSKKHDFEWDVYGALSRDRTYIFLQNPLDLKSNRSSRGDATDVSETPGRDVWSCVASLGRELLRLIGQYGPNERVNNVWPRKSWERFVHFPEKKWTTRDGRKVPDTRCITFANEAVTFIGQFCCRHGGFRLASVNGFRPWFAAEVYKAYLLGACRVIRAHGGEVTAFDGDRVMASFRRIQKHSGGEDSPKNQFPCSQDKRNHPRRTPPHHIF